MSRISEIANQLGELSIIHRAAFAASCCCRLAPNMIPYDIQTGVENFSIAEKLLSDTWLCIELGNFGNIDWKNRIKDCYKVLPNTEGTSAIYTNLATSSISAIIYMMEGILTNDRDNRFALVGQICVDSIDAYLQTVNAPQADPYLLDNQFETWLQNSPIMLSEIQKQDDDLSYLKSKPSLKTIDIEWLCSSPKFLGIHPVRRGLILDI